MSFKRGSLHGIDRNEKSSPLKNNWVNIHLNVVTFSETTIKLTSNWKQSSQENAERLPMFTKATWPIFLTVVRPVAMQPKTRKTMICYQLVTTRSVKSHLK